MGALCGMNSPLYVLFAGSRDCANNGAVDGRGDVEAFPAKTAAASRLRILQPD